jgi:hypothetical protein
MNYDHVPDRRPHVYTEGIYTVGMDGTDQPIATDPAPRSCDHQVADKSSAAYATAATRSCDHQVADVHRSCDHQVADDFPVGNDDLEIRITSIVVAPHGADMYEPGVTEISIQDNAGGEYVTVKQLYYQVERSSIEIDPDRWPVLRRSIEWMLGQCRG